MIIKCDYVKMYSLINYSPALGTRGYGDLNNL